MPSDSGFTSMAAAKADTAAPEIGIGLLGYAFMGKAHTNAYKKIPYLIYPPPAVPRLVAIAGRNAAAAKEAAVRYGYERYYTDWKEMLKNDRLQLPTPRRPSPPPRPACTSCARSPWRATPARPPRCSRPSARPGSSTR